ncbi:MAG: sugar transferase [Nanoarchaeota archaeon]
MIDYVFLERLGKYGKPIYICKLRTMEKNAEEKTVEMINKNGLDELGKPFNDSRITCLGKILRRYWIDELPQLYNLSKGDLKLVGIRAKKQESWEFYPNKIRALALKQKPGLMGIQYAYDSIRDFEEILEIMQEYLFKWNKDPLKTDKQYFNKIIRNIIFKGVRSH